MKRSDTHHASALGLLMGFASLYPFYGCGRHCEERSDEAIHLSACGAMDCLASLAMTIEVAGFVGWAKARQRRAHHSIRTHAVRGWARFALPTLHIRALHTFSNA